jgi:hypothetical protein
MPISPADRYPRDGHSIQTLNVRFWPIPTRGLALVRMTDALIMIDEFYRSTTSVCASPKAGSMPECRWQIRVDYPFGY